MALNENIELRTNERIAILLKDLMNDEIIKLGVEIRVFINSLNEINEFKDYEDFKARLDRIIQIFKSNRKTGELSLDELVTELSYELLGTTDIEVVIKKNSNKKPHGQ